MARKIFQYSMPF